ncbi:hypothetical protein P43SY_005466 [Pythium insidiosum]|uniref:Uncharacterized protein n=1 Tax=Pythium insidiosum TaxID=114742 RepID=A0AAD5M2L5_PYTIN|nr:hypothetical protein P43SY_005466 [Pythium insidiosum]KAJ0404869.1 hypothetical protein ATCC90586_007819 [Pythium insidiosum]
MELYDENEMDELPQHADVYERLYDRRSYTGVYRKRFELDIQDLSETVVHDLSEAIRPNLNHDVDPKTKRPFPSKRRYLCYFKFTLLNCRASSNLWTVKWCKQRGNDA